MTLGVLDRGGKTKGILGEDKGTGGIITIEGIIRIGIMIIIGIESIVIIRTGGTIGGMITGGGITGMNREIIMIGTIGGITGGTIETIGIIRGTIRGTIGIIETTGIIEIIETIETTGIIEKRGTIETIETIGKRGITEEITGTTGIIDNIEHDLYAFNQ